MGILKTYDWIVVDMFHFLRFFYFRVSRLIVRPKGRTIGTEDTYPITSRYSIHVGVNNSLISQNT